MDQWQTWKSHKFVIHQAWEAKSILQEIETIRLAASEVSANTAKARDYDFKDAMTDVINACMPKMKDFYADVPDKNITKQFSFWADKNAKDFVTVSNAWVRIFEDCIKRSPALEGVLASVSSNRDGLDTAEQMKIVRSCVPSLLTDGFFSIHSSAAESLKLKVTQNGLSSHRAAVIALLRPSILSSKGLQLLKKNFLHVTPLNQRLQKGVPWTRILSFAHFRTYHIRLLSYFAQFFKAKVVQEVSLLLAIRSPKNFATIGKTEITPVLLAGPQMVLDLRGIYETDTDDKNVAKEDDDKNVAKENENVAENNDNNPNEATNNNTNEANNPNEATNYNPNGATNDHLNETTTNKDDERPIEAPIGASATITTSGETSPADQGKDKDIPGLIGFLFNTENFDKPLSSIKPKGGSLYNRIIMAATNEFMEDLLDVRIRYGVDPNFKDADRPDSNIYLKAYLRYVWFVFFLTFDLVKIKLKCRTF